MSPAFVLEPTYRRLKRSLMDGLWPMGAKLEAVKLAGDFGVSMTPVRDSLNQLVGEGLVDFTPGEGFRVPMLTERDLRELLDVSRTLLEHAINADIAYVWRGDGTAAEDYAGRLTTALIRLAYLSGNTVLIRLTERIGERLHVVRNQEEMVIPEANSLLIGIEQSLELAGADRQKAISRYHERCRHHVPELIAAICR